MCTIRRKKNSSHTSVLSFTLPPLCLLVLCFGLRLRLSKEQSNRRGRRYERRGKEGRKEKNPYFWSFLFVSWEIFFLHRQLVWRQTPETAHTPSQPSPPNLLLVASHLLLSPPLFHHYGTTQHTLLFFLLFLSFVYVCMWCLFLSLVHHPLSFLLVHISPCFELPYKFSLWVHIRKRNRKEKKKKRGLACWHASCLPHILVEWESFWCMCLCLQ